jgi:hypothetical protein
VAFFKNKPDNHVFKMNGLCATVNRFIKSVALLSPMEKVTSLCTRHPQNVIAVLKPLQLKLDQVLKKQYARKSQVALDNKNREEAVNNSHFIR